MYIYISMYMYMYIHVYICIILKALQGCRKVAYMVYSQLVNQNLKLKQQEDCLLVLSDLVLILAREREESHV